MKEEYLKFIKSSHPLYQHWYNLKNSRVKNQPSMCLVWTNNRIEFFKWCIDHGWQEGYRFLKHEKDKPHSPQNTYIIPSEKEVFEIIELRKNKLTEQEIAEIRKLLRERFPVVMIAKKYQVSVSTISAIKSRRALAHMV